MVLSNGDEVVVTLRPGEPRCCTEKSNTGGQPKGHATPHCTCPFTHSLSGQQRGCTAHPQNYFLKTFVIFFLNHKEPNT